MRSLKTFMKAKKPMRRCGECKCVTLQCRRENDEFCNCGEQMTFMTYDELVALGSPDDIVNELNKNGKGYLDSLVKEGHAQITTEQGTEAAVIVSERDTPLMMEGYGFLYLISGAAPGAELGVWFKVPNAPRYTMRFSTNDANYGSVSPNTVEALKGTSISYDDNKITIGKGSDTTIVTATPEDGYQFTGWSTGTQDPLPTVLDAPDYNLTATFEEIPMADILIYFTEGSGTVVDQNGDEVVDGDEYSFLPGTVATANNNVLTIGTGDDAVTLTATPETGFTFAGRYYWTEETEEELPITSLTLNGHTEVTPKMVPPTVTLTVRKTPEGHGQFTDLDGNEVTSITAYVGDEIWTDANDVSLLYVAGDFSNDRQFLMTPTGSDTLIGGFIGEHQITNTPMTLDGDEILDVKFDEDSR